MSCMLSVCLSVLRSPIVTGCLLFLVLELLSPVHSLPPALCTCGVCGVCFHSCDHRPARVQIHGIDVVPIQPSLQLQPQMGTFSFSWPGARTRALIHSLPQ